jgi:hypothetical protein
VQGENHHKGGEVVLYICITDFFIEFHYIYCHVYGMRDENNGL